MPSGRPSVADASPPSSSSSRAWYLALAVLLIQSIYVMMLLNRSVLVPPAADTASASWTDTNNAVRKPAMETTAAPMTANAKQSHVVSNAQSVPHLADLHSQRNPQSNNNLQSNQNNDDDDFALAREESFGFFTDIPSAHWRLAQDIARAMPHHLPATYDKTAAFYYRPRGYYQNNWEPDFSACTAQRMVGPIRDGHKWVCDPHRLRQQQQQPPCLVYSLGSNGDFSFERALLELVPNCEVHVFDPGRYGSRVTLDSNIHYHQYGLKPSYDTDPALLDGKGELPRGNFLTLPQIIQELGHQGRTISVMKVDIEGGEWTTFRDWIGVQEEGGVLIQQLLVEVHDTPPIVNTMFAELHKAGYAMFHKEPNAQFAAGDCIEFAWIKLRQSFFGTEGQPVEHSAEALRHAEMNAQEYQLNKAKKEYNYGREMRLTGVV